MALDLFYVVLVALDLLSWCIARLQYRNDLEAR